MTTKSAAFFWVVTLCNLIEVPHWFRGAYCPISVLLLTGFVLALFFNPEDGAACYSETSLNFVRLHSIVSRTLQNHINLVNISNCTHS
jgi:hypothetical protein